MPFDHPAFDEPLTILIVDDDEGHCELIRRNLRRAGWINPIRTFHDGAQALDFVFARGAYEHRVGSLLVLLDLQMPGLDGAEVLRQIKSHPPYSQVPVIILTTTDDPREINRCYALGCNVYLTKPVSPSDFIEAIRRLGLFMTLVKVPDVA